MSDLIKHTKDSELKELIRKYICPTATDNELAIASGVIKSNNLDIWKREAYVVKYGQSPAQVIVGYQVYLKRANSTGLLNGYEVDDGTPGKATITIYRKDWDHPFKWTVYEEEVSKGQSTWKTMPKFMLKKVAIAQGMRLAFPDEVGGLPYIPEEMGLGNSENIDSEPLTDGQAGDTTGEDTDRVEEVAPDLTEEVKGATTSPAVESEEQTRDDKQGASDSAVPSMEVDKATILQMLEQKTEGVRYPPSEKQLDLATDRLFKKCMNISEVIEWINKHYHAEWANPGINISKLIDDLK
jgi:phage recombination protein Bet